MLRFSVVASVSGKTMLQKRNGIGARASRIIEAPFPVKIFRQKEEKAAGWAGE
jgi:hypothetical protein